MLTFYQAFDAQDIFSHMRTLMQQQPLTSVFSREHFLVENVGMERWLAQQLAQQFGVFANYQFSLPEAFFHTLTRNLTTNTTPFTDERLWQIEALLRELDGAVFAPLQAYLSGDNLPLKRYQLAQVLTRLFAHYQLARPELLQAWQQQQLQTQHPSEHWQQALWQKILTDAPLEDAMSAHQAAIAKLQHTARGQLRYHVPERLFVLIVSTLSPIFLHYLQALSLHCPLHIYTLNPLVRAKTPHPLLTGLGQQGFAFWHSVENLLGSDVVNNLHPLHLNKPHPTLLAQLQNDLAQGVSLPVSRVLPRDDSISIHACHSRMREVEVAKNQLLDSLEKHPQLQVHEIAIVAPNIHDYAPYLQAVLNDIPHSIASSHLPIGQAVCTAFLQFLNVCDSRFGWQTVLELLEHPSIYPSFDLSIDDVCILKHWLLQTEVRWGQAATHKSQFELPPLQENTWQASLERLLMGYAVNDEHTFVAGILPYKHLEGSAAQALGGLCDFVQLLFTASRDLQQPHTLPDWSEQCRYYATHLFAHLNPLDQQPLYALLAKLSETLTTPQPHLLTLAVIKAWLSDQLTTSTAASGLLRGQLTCCSINAVRGVPFQVIIVLGMNEGEFPRNQHAPAFDLIAQFPRRTDFNPRSDQRQQFLQLLFAAQQQLILTYQGQSLAQNQIIPPAVVVSELVEVLAHDYQLSDIIINQPLQAFSRRYFSAESPRLFSYAKTACDTAVALAAEKSPASLWWQGTIPAKQEHVIETIELFSFFRHPQRYFLRRQLNLYLQPLAATPPEREPFCIDGLHAYSLYQDWIEALLNQQPFSLKKLQAQGKWLSGVMAELSFVQTQTQLIEFVEQIKSLTLGEKIAPLAVDRQCGSWRIVGKLEHRYQHGSLFYRFAGLKGKDFFIALLHHLLLNQQQPETTHLLSTDYHLVFSPTLTDSTLLIQLIDLYNKGQQQPATLFPDSVLDYLKQAWLLKNSSRTSKSAFEVASQGWLQALEQPYQLELQQLYRGSQSAEEYLNADFIALCETLLPIWETSLN